MKAHLVETCTAVRKSNLSPFFDKNKEILCSFFCLVIFFYDIACCYNHCYGLLTLVSSHHSLGLVMGKQFAKE